MLDVPDGERAHYSSKTYDIEYDFPFGIQELEGVAYRTDYDLKKHGEASGKPIEYFDLLGKRVNRNIKIYSIIKKDYLLQKI